MKKKNMSYYESYKQQENKKSKRSKYLTGEVQELTEEMVKETHDSGREEETEEEAAEREEQLLKEFEELEVHTPYGRLQNFRAALTYLTLILTP